MCTSSGSVSRRHCTFINRGGKLHVRDDGSSNGTFVNEERVEESDLEIGDIVRLGQSRVSVGVPFPAKE